MRASLSYRPCSCHVVIMQPMPPPGDNRPRFMLDTNVFNRIMKDPAFDLTAVAVLCGLDGPDVGLWLATGIQLGELRETPDGEIRAKLLATFRDVTQFVLLAATFALDVEGAGFDQASWNDGSGLVEKMQARLDEVEPARKKRDRQKRLKPGEPDLNPVRDILIAETTLKAGATLVTGDKHLHQVAVEFGLKAVIIGPHSPA